MRRAGREVREEGLVRHQCLLLADPLDRLVRHVGHEVVALFRRLLGLDGDRALVDRRVVLMGLSADEAEEVLEAAPGGPVLERPHRARLPHGHLVALAELRRRVPVQLQRLGERGAGVRAHRAVARRRGRDLRDAAHTHRVMVAAAQQRRAGGRAERGGVEAVVLQPLGGEPFGVRRVDRTTECTRSPEPDVVNEDDQDVGSSLRRPQLLDRRERGIWSFASYVVSPTGVMSGIGRTSRWSCGLSGTVYLLTHFREQVGLDSPPTPPRCDGRGDDRGLGNRRGAGCHCLGHDRRLRHGVADDSDSSCTSWTERHVILLPSQMLHRPRWRR